MRVLHILNNSAYTSPYIDFVNRNFISGEHIFFMIKSPEYMKVSSAENVINFVIDKNKNKNEFTRALKKAGTYSALFYQCLKADKIIIHALYDSSIIKFFFYNKWLLRKSNWVIWGADLYDSKKSKISKKNERKEYMKSTIIKKISGIIGLPGDCEIARERYQTGAREFPVMYINAVGTKFLDRLNYKEKDTVSIQIGNSADPSNLHIELLDALSKYKDKRIMIYAPLSYGDQDYAQKVKKHGEQIFVDKFTAMMTYMSPEKYSEYLSGIDILIFNHKRQQGLGNIFPMIYLGKKVFIRNDVSSWDYFIKDLGINIYNTNEIENLEFEKFIYQDTISRNVNIQRAKETFYSEEYLKNLWQDIFLRT